MSGYQQALWAKHKWCASYPMARCSQHTLLRLQLLAAFVAVGRESRSKAVCDDTEQHDRQPADASNKCNLVVLLVSSSIGQIAAPVLHSRVADSPQFEVCVLLLVPGTVGSGYLTAAMAKMVRPDGFVLGVEKVPELVEHAKRCIAAGGLCLTRHATSLPWHAVPDTPFQAQIHIGAMVSTATGLTSSLLFLFQLSSCTLADG